MTTATKNKIESVQAYTVLAGTQPTTSGGQYISVLIKNEDLFAGRPVFYPSRDNILYDVKNDFKPIGRKNGQSLPQPLIEAYNELLTVANESYQAVRQQSGKDTGVPESVVKDLENVLKTQSAEIDNLRAQLARPVVPAGKTPAELELEKLKKEFEALKALHEPKKPVVHEKFTKILNYLKKGLSIYVWGSAGTGKSHMMEQIAKELYGTQTPVEDGKYFAVNSIQDKFDLTGYEDAGGVFRPKPLYHAMVNGGLFFIDELDNSSPDALVVLNMVLAQKYFDFPAVGIVRCHPDFRIVSAGNTRGRGAENGYVGRNELDVSSLNRFEFVNVEYSPAIEEELCKGDNELLEFGRQVRQTAVDCGLQLLFTYRQFNAFTAMDGVQPLEETVEESLLKGLPVDDLKLLVRNLSLPSSNKYFKALKSLA